MKQNIVWFDIPSLDIDRALGFYSAVLGRQIKKEEFEGVVLGVLPTPDGGQQGDVVLVKGFKPSADGVMIYLDVDGRLKDAVIANGGTVQKDIHSIAPYGFCAEVLDSEGNCIALHSLTEN
jgi:predicted enzyme related to lactoylglutathione lyase